MFKSMIAGILMLFSSVVSATTFHVEHDGPVEGYYMGASAGNASYLSIIVNDVTRFEGFNNHTTPINTYTSFGNYSAGDIVEFVMYGLSVPANTWYSDITRNSDGGTHMHYVPLVLNAHNALYITWEDLPLNQSDLDYNDGNFVLTNVVASIPEPETYTMFLVGLGLLAFSIHRKGGGVGGFVKDDWNGFRPVV